MEEDGWDPNAVIQARLIAQQMGLDETDLDDMGFDMAVMQVGDGSAEDGESLTVLTFTPSDVDDGTGDEPEDEESSRDTDPMFSLPEDVADESVDTPDDEE